MLSHLSIKNYALIDEIDISFSSGLSIITGETGAGKSIILGALSLLLGQRSEGKYFFNQQKKCVIEGHFSIKDYHLQDFFELQDIDYEEHTILRREIHHEGKSRAFINDTPVTLTTLKALGERLIAIHSQHAVLEINTESFQFLALDALAGNADLQQEFSKEFRNFKRIQAQLETALEEEKRLALEADYHQFLFEELEQAELNDPNEEEKLQEELKVLSNAEEIKSNLQGMYQLMMGHEGSLVEQVQQAANHLDQVASFSLPLQDLHARLKSSFWS